MWIIKIILCENDLKINLSLNEEHVREYIPALLAIERMIGKVAEYVFDKQFSDMKNYHIEFWFHYYIFQKFLKITIIDINSVRVPDSGIVRWALERMIHLYTWSVFQRQIFRIGNFRIEGTFVMHIFHIGEMNEE